LASSYLLTNLLDLCPKHSALKYCTKPTSQVLYEIKHMSLKSTEKAAYSVWCYIQTHQSP
jgi:hypothetical protein